MVLLNRSSGIAVGIVKRRSEVVLKVLLVLIMRLVTKRFYFPIAEIV